MSKELEGVLPEILWVKDENLRGAVKKSYADALASGGWSLEDMEKSHIMEILNHTTGIKEKAAKILKISKPALYDKMKRFEIPVDFGKRD